MSAAAVMYEDPPAADEPKAIHRRSRPTRMLHAASVCSSAAHAGIRSVGLSCAAASPGVVLALNGRPRASLRQLFRTLVLNCG
jgi:hypothetical protein